MRTRRDVLVRGEKKKWKECSPLPRDHPRNRFSPSIHFSATRKNSTHGTLWRLCARTARLVESCSKNNSLAYDIRAGRLVSSSRVASRPLAGQMTGTHVFPHWRTALIFVCVIRRSCRREGEGNGESARGRKKRGDWRGRMATWPALCCFGAPPPIRSSLSAESPRFPTFPFCPFAFFPLTRSYAVSPITVMSRRWKLRLSSLCRVRRVNP